MPKCPYCGKEISRLFFEKKILYTVKIVERQLTYNEEGREELYRCPYCWRVIAINEKDAERFLSGQ